MKSGPMRSQAYWNRNLDTDNLSGKAVLSRRRLEEAVSFAETPEFEWLRGRVGSVDDRLLVELGGGVGMHAVLWARAGARVVVCDLALERMKAMRRLARRAGLEDRIACVVGRAEDLPFAGGAVDVVFTKSVLIHTELPLAAREIRRVLAPAGHGAFIEPLDRNPIIRLYRRLLAPRIWRSITRYFDRGAMEDLRRPFGRLYWKPFYFLSAGSFFWQYGRKDLRRFHRSLRFWMRRDAALLRGRWRPAWWCWFAAIHVRKSG